MKPIISLSEISKTFPNGISALSQFSLDIGEGEFMSLLGPSGCGKSTVLRLIAGLTEPTDGTINWPMSASDGSGEHDIGFVFQEPTLMPWATVFDNVYLPLRLKGISRKEGRDRIAEVLAMVGLSQSVGLFPRELSGGMKMRVSIARALVTRPKILLMDEPFAALDEITRNRLNDDLLRLWQEQRWTVLFVTHSVYESVYLSGRIVVMATRPGRVFADIGVAASYPRDDDFRTSPSYNETCKRASVALRSAMETTGQP